MDATQNLVENVTALANILPPLSVPVLIVDLIKNKIIDQILFEDSKYEKLDQKCVLFFEFLVGCQMFFLLLLLAPSD